MMRTLLGYIFLAALFLFFSTMFRLNTPVQAAQPAPPVVKECQKVNTAKVSDALIIIVFRCEPENGPPYLLNSFGFMVVEE